VRAFALAGAGPAAIVVPGAPPGIGIVLVALCVAAAALTGQDRVGVVGQHADADHEQADQARSITRRT
jgi:hypothetical protein